MRTMIKVKKHLVGDAFVDPESIVALGPVDVPEGCIMLCLSGGHQLYVHDSVNEVLERMARAVRTLELVKP